MKRIVSAVALAAALLLTVVPPSGADTAHPPARTLGFRPNGGFLDLAAFEDAEAWLGRPIRWTMQMTGWRSVDDMSGSVNGLFKSGAALPQLADRLDLVITVPLAFGGATAKTAAGQDTIRRNLAATAGGAWDRAFRKLASRLVDVGYGDAVIRLGHEFTGHWYPWSAQADPAGYVRAFRHVHDVLQSVAPRLRFEWNAAHRTWPTYGPGAYPGDAYVDVVGMDLYYRGATTWSDQLWAKQYESILDSHRDFAVAHGKQLSYAEWATTIDEPRFVQHMHDWFASLPDTGPGSLLHHTYFSPNREYDVDNHPRTRERYAALFGGAAAEDPVPEPDDPEEPDTPDPIDEPTDEPEPAQEPPPPDSGQTPPPPGAGQPTVIIDSGSVKEGNGGSVSLPFRIRLSEPADHPVSVVASTRAATATAREDFWSRFDVAITFQPGQTVAWFGVPVIGDTRNEPDESLRVKLTGVTGAQLLDAVATGTIVDDD